MSSVREGARSPTPNVARETEFAGVDPDMAGMTIWRIQVCLI